MKITIPASLDEAQSSLNGLDALLTAREWERAAIVFAFTEPGNGQGARQPLSLSGQRLSLAAFADLGISGLRSRPRVTAYRGAWQSAIDAGQVQPVSPGDQVQLPNLPWGEAFADPTPTAVVQASAFRSVIRDPERFRAALRDEPEVAAALAQRVVDTPSVRTAIESRLAEPIRDQVTLLLNRSMMRPEAGKLRPFALSSN